MQKINENILRNFCHIKSQNFSGKISRKILRKFSGKILRKRMKDFGQNVMKMCHTES